VSIFKIFPEGAYPFIKLNDSLLVQQCSLDTYTASGPGGQHRNRTYSAVRIRHLETGISAVAEESRSQHENRQAALHRIRRALALRVRKDPAHGAPAVDGRISYLFRCEASALISSKNDLYPLFCATILDMLYAAEGKIGEAADRLSVTTGRMNKLLGKDKNLFTAANQVRGCFGLKPLILKK